MEGHATTEIVSYRCPRRGPIRRQRSSNSKANGNPNGFLERRNAKRLGACSRARVGAYAVEYAKRGTASSRCRISRFAVVARAGVLAAHHGAPLILRNTRPPCWRKIDVRLRGRRRWLFEPSTCLHNHTKLQAIGCRTPLLSLGDGRDERVVLQLATVSY